RHGCLGEARHAPGDRVVADIDREAQYGVLIAAQPPGPAHGQVESLLPLDQLRKCLTTDGLDYIVHIGDRNTPVFALPGIAAQVEVGLALDPEDAHVFEALDLPLAVFVPRFEPRLDLLGQLFELVQVGADDLD